jgi:hypothetical protein
MKTLAAIVALIALGSFTAIAMDDQAALPEGLEKFTATGETKTCVAINSIRTSRVIDGSHILFRMGAGVYYLNRLGERCPSLAFERNFVYETGDSRLCRNQIIRVINPRDQITRSACGLGEFERLEKSSAAAS